MPGRGRRVALALVAIALVLSAGRAVALLLADRWWDASVSPRVAEALSQRALLGLALEVSLILLFTVWFFVQFTLAARIALPDRATPERDPARTWPARLPRWSLAVVALLLGVLLGSGAGGWLDRVLLTLDGVSLGVRDPLLGADLGAFAAKFPLWLELQRKAVVLSGTALLGVVLLHLAGSTIHLSGRRLWISPRARGQLAVLLALLALSLGWSAGLEPYRLAAGLRGPLLASEFGLHRLVAQIQLGLAGITALLSLLWWFRARGSEVLALWALFGVAVLVGRGLPRKSDAATSDPAWRAAARGLDSVAFQLHALEPAGTEPRVLASALVPTLWDGRVVAQAIADSGRSSEPQRGWLQVAGGPRPVWFTVRQRPNQPAALLAISDDRVSPSGGTLAWRETDSAPIPGALPFRELPPSASQPLAPRVYLGTEGDAGVRLGSLPRRLVLAWALQEPRAFSAPSETRLGWRLDPASRLRAVAPFAEWTVPRARLLGETLVWQSDGLLTSRLFPASRRVHAGSAGERSLVRSTFLGVVYAATGQVRVFLRSDADSLGKAWARITRPLIEPRGSIPAGLLEREPYPEELLLAQVQALEGPAWSAGRLELGPDGAPALPPEAVGGSEIVVPFVRANRPTVGAVLQAVRTADGDDLTLIPLDTLWTVEASANLAQRWKRFPFVGAMDDSVDAVEATFETGRVRYAVAAEGVVAYQPAWSVNPQSSIQLVLVNLAFGRPGGGPMLLGTGRTLPEAWKNLQHLMAPTVGAGAEALLAQAWRLLLHADSAMARLDFQELRRTLANLKDLLEPRRR